MVISSEFKYLSFNGAYEEGNNLYVSNNMFNGMLKLDKETLNAEYVCSFTDAEMDILAQHHKVHKYKEYIIFAPDSAKGIHVYDTTRQKMVYYDIDKKTDSNTRCIDSYVIGKELWLLYAYAEHPIVIIDLDNFQIIYFDGLIDKLPKEIRERNKPVFWSEFTKEGNKLYGAVWHSAYIVELDTETKECQVHKLKGEMHKLTSALYFEDLFWVTEYENVELACWNRKGDFVAIYSMDEKIQVEGKGNFAKLILCKDNIYLITNKEDCVFYFDKETRRIKVFAFFPKGFEVFGDMRKKWRRFLGYDVVENVIRLYPSNANMMLDVDIVNVQIKSYKFVLDNKYDEKWYRKRILFPKIKEENHTQYFDETKGFTLGEYIEYLSNVFEG